MKTLIIFQTKYGSTRQYAEWIQTDLKADLENVNNADKIDFSKYDRIIFGSLFYMGKIKIKPFIVKHWDKIKNKKLVLYSVSGRKEDDPNVQVDYKKNFDLKYRRKMKYFNVQGRITYKDFTLIDQFLVKLARKKELDAVKKENLKGILKYVKKIKM